VNAVVYSPDNTMFATARSGRFIMIEIRDANTSKLVATLRGQTSFVQCLAWTADGKTLISGSDDGSITTWSTTSWREILVLDAHMTNVSAIAISPNGQIFASASSDRTARLWSLDNGQPIGSPLKHENIVTCVSFSADGKLLATGCYDHNAYIWDLSAFISEAGLSDLSSDPIVSRKVFFCNFPGTECPPPQDNDNLLSYVRDSSVNLSYLNLITFKHPRLMLLQHNKSRMTSKYCQRLLAIPQIALMCVPRISLGFLLTYLYSQVPSAHQPTHATSVPALDHLPTSSTHQSATLVPSSTLRSFSSFFHPSQPDPDVAPHLSPRPWLGFFSRRAPSARTVGQRKSVCSLLLSSFLYSIIPKRLYVAPAPKTKATSKGQLKQHPNQGGAMLLPLLRPQAADTTTTSPLAPRPAITTPVDVADTLDGSTKEAGCCTRFWSCICCVSTTKSSDIQ
jgi:WD40 repeat protein